MMAVWWCTKYCSSYLNQDPRSWPFLSDHHPSSSQLWAAEEMLSMMTELPNVLYVTKFKGLEFMPISNRVENQRPHIHIFPAGTCWYKSEYWFYQFTSNYQLVHSNHTGCWIKPFIFAEARTGLCERAQCQGNCFCTATPLFPKMPKQLPTPCFISLLLQNATRRRAYTPDSTGVDVEHCWMHLPWWDCVKMPMVDSKVSCFDLGFWERGSSSFPLGAALVNFL